MGEQEPGPEERGETWGAIPERAFRGDLGASDFKAMGIIGKYDRLSLERGKGAGCFLSINRLAAEIGMDPSQFRRSVEKLVRRGYIQRTPRGEIWEGYVLRIIYRGEDSTVTTPRTPQSPPPPDSTVTTPRTGESSGCGPQSPHMKIEIRENRKYSDDDPANNGLSEDAVAAVIQRWRDVAMPAGAAKAERLTEKRRALIEAALAENGLSDVLASIDRISKSKWAMGGGEEGWRATLAWVLAPGKPAEILEGQHDDFRKSPRPYHEVLAEQRGDGLMHAINRRVYGATHGDEFSRAARRWANSGDADGAPGEPETPADYAEFSEIGEEVPPWP